MKKYLPLLVFLIAALAVFFWYLYHPKEEAPGYMEPTGSIAQPNTKNV